VGLIFFLLGTIGFIFLSRHALVNQHSHGFPRFFAFEAILGLVILNTPFWFVQPFSIPQLISWALLLAAGILAIAALYYLHQFGATDNSIRDADRILFEKTTRLVTVGPYRYIRHPMYASLLYLAWGVFLKQINLISTLLVIVTSLAVFLTAVYEEGENLLYFKDDYASYMKFKKRFIPYVF
jgi:protein-S-isoprenylcysteine O-methyltransferase Ste14